MVSHFFKKLFEFLSEFKKNAVFLNENFFKYFYYKYKAFPLC